jgi:hypothetical protein
MVGLSTITLKIDVIQEMTVEQIMSAAKTKTSLEFSVKFCKKGEESKPCAIYNFTFDPSNVRFIDPITESEFVIRDGRYEYTLTLDLNGGKSADPTDAQTVEYGEEIVLPANPVKDYYRFNKWTGVNQWEEKDYNFYSGYRNEKEKKDYPDGMEIPADSGKYYGGYVDIDGKWWPNSIVMTDDVTLTAQYETIPVNVGISNHSTSVWDSESFVLSDPLSSIILPEPDEVQGQKFVGWMYFAGYKEGQEIWLPYDFQESNDAIGTIALEEVNEWGKYYSLDIHASYKDATTATFVTSSEASFEVKVVNKYDETTGDIKIPASEFYTEEVKAAEAKIEGFLYWTLKAPEEDGSYIEAPLPFDFTNEENFVSGNFELYPYAGNVQVTVTFNTLVNDKKGFPQTFTMTLVSGNILSEELLLAAKEKAEGLVVDLGVEVKYWTKDEPNDDGTYTEDPEEFKPAAIEGDTTLYAYWGEVVIPVTIAPALNLLDEIGMNFYFTLAEGEDPADYSVQYTYESYWQKIEEKKAFSELTPSNGEYKLTALNARSDEMSYPVEITVLKGEDVVTSEVFTIQWIANEWLVDGKHDQYATLIKAMLQYGHYAEIEFNNNAGATIVPDGAPGLVAIPDDYAITDDPTDLADYIEYFQSGLALDSAIGMNLYIKPLEGYGLEDFEITVTNAAGKAVKIPDPKMSGEEIKVTMAGILPDEMLDSYKINVTVDGVTGTFTRSVMNCAYEIQKKGRAFNLLKSLYQYCLAANAIW